VLNRWVGFVLFCHTTQEDFDEGEREVADIGLGTG